MRNLNIQIVENGFIVNEAREDPVLIGKMWAFESPGSLAIFVKEWAEEKYHSSVDKVKK